MYLISKNLRWGIRKRMESGTYHTSSAPYGYKQVNYDLVHIPDQIEIVKGIFNAFLQGKSTTKIADDLNRLRPDADKHWHHTTIERILKNEKYAGCSLYQKSYTSDDLPFKRTENNGEVLSYYAPDTHNGIISKADFDKAQALLQLKSVGPCPRKDSAFSNMRQPLSARDLEYSRQKGNRLALRQPCHLRNKVLPQFTLCARRSPASDPAESHPKSGRQLHR